MRAWPIISALTRTMLAELPTLDGPDPFAQPSASGERPKWGQRYSASSATGSPRSPGARAGSPSSNNGSPRAGVKDMKKYISDTGSDSDEDPKEEKKRKEKEKKAKAKEEKEATTEQQQQKANELKMEQQQQQQQQQHQRQDPQVDPFDISNHA